MEIEEFFFFLCIRFFRIAFGREKDLIEFKYSAVFIYNEILFIKHLSQVLAFNLN